jgi:two-component system, LuxR family, sensor kinase FixL
MTMSERTKTMGPIAHPPLLPRPAIIVGLAYLAGYVLLDWISFIEPYGPFDITPWNPNTGLSLGLGLIFGPRLIPFLFLGPLLSGLVLNQSIVPWSVELSFAALIGGGYSVALFFLLRRAIFPAAALAAAASATMMIITMTIELGPFMTKRLS